MPKSARSAAVKPRKPVKAAKKSAPGRGRAAAQAAKSATNKVTPFLMFNDRIAEAIDLYTKTFPDCEVRRFKRASKGGPIVSAEFVVGGQRFLAYAGGPHFSFSEGFSLFVDCADQREVDLYWDRLLKAGSKPSMCGWINDPFGLSWQIIPRRLMELMDDPDPVKAKAVLDAMLQMVKIDVKTLEKAYASA